MRLIAPLKGIQPAPIAPIGGEIYITQKYGNVWIADRDLIINGVFIKKGEEVYKKAFGMPFHNGDDIRAPKGTPIIACHDAFVIESVTKDTGLGLRICIAWEADGYLWVAVHGHLDSSAFPEIGWNINERRFPVKQGQVIGYVDSTGFSTGHHLHFMGYQYKNGQRLNTNNGVNGAITLWPYIKENYMEFMQVQGEATIVGKNDNGQYFEIATSPELYPTVAKIFALEGKVLPVVSRAEVDANKIGQAEAGITFSL